MLYSLDLLAAYTPLTAAARSAVSLATGIPEAQITLAGTHTHSAPAVGTMHLDSTKRFYDRTIALLTQAAEDALADRQLASPYAMTIILTCANGYNNYLPSDFAFTHGGYEVDSRKFPQGSAEQLADTFLEMLREQKKQ